MGLGAFFAIFGAILFFAVRGNTSFLDLHTTGLIFMIAGGFFLYRHYRSPDRGERDGEDDEQPKGGGRTERKDRNEHETPIRPSWTVRDPLPLHDRPNDDLPRS